MPKAVKKTQATKTPQRRSLRGSADVVTLVNLVATLIVENDQLAAEVARLKGEPAPPTFMEYYEQIKRSR